MPEVIIILLGLAIVLYYFVRRSQKKKTKVSLHGELPAKTTQASQVTIEEVTRSQHADQFSKMSLPITGAIDEDIIKVKEIIKAALSKGENPRQIGGKIATALSPFQWEDFDIWVKRFRKAGEWPPLWDDVAEYYYAQEEASVEELIALLKKEDLLQVAEKKGINLKKSAKKDEMLAVLNVSLTDTDRQDVLVLLYPEGDKALHKAKSYLLGHTVMALSVEKVKLANWQKWGIKFVEIMTTPDSCTWCEKFADKKMKIETLIKQQIPPIHPGCRCTILPADD
jgi:hypothetical protein